MNPATPLIDAAVRDAQAMRSAGPDLLGLALMDARNRTLGWLTAFEGLRWAGELAGFDPPGWLAGQAGWFQERWIARFVQRARGAAADPGVPRLPSLEPRADAWFDPDASTRSQRWLAGALPAPAELQDYLAASLETTLALLDKAQPDDAGLHVFRLALMHEDRVGETLATLVQALDLSPERCQPLAARGLWPDLPSRSRRDAMWLPGQTVRLGAAPCGFSPDAETPAREVQVPEFEIDAQPVTWAQFVEFAGDGGYDDPRWWTPAGWDWLETSQRRAPRYVEQMGGGVLARRLGRLQRLPLAQGVVHVSAHEAAAWCQWAGRRLPAEAEWALAALVASARGFAWGDVLEWVGARRAQAPSGLGHGPLGLGSLDTLPPAGGPPWRVLRGASAWGSPRLRHLQARRFAAPERDELFVGFRSCAV